jgi:hypothetical protein
MIKTGMVELIPTSFTIRWAGQFLDHAAPQSALFPVIEDASMKMMSRLARQSWPPAPGIHRAIRSSKRMNDVAVYFTDFEVLDYK